MRKVISMLLIALLTSGMLSGCVSVPLTTVRNPENVRLPEPAGRIPPAPVGDSRVDSAHNVNLYFISDQQQLMGLMRTIKVGGDDTLIETTLHRLLSEGEQGTGMLPIAPEGTKLNWLEQSRGIVTVDLSVNALEQNAQQLCWMEAAIVATLNDLPGVEKVNILIGGKAESMLSVPTGTMHYVDQALAALWGQRESEARRFSENPGNVRIERDATLYFPGWLDNLLLPETRIIEFSSANFAQTLFDALLAGPQQGGQSHAVLPADTKLASEPMIETLEDGRKVLILSFNEDLYQRLQEEGLSRWQLFSALTLTLYRFIPESIDGVVIGIDGKIVTELQDGVKRLEFADGVITPQMFDAAVGREARIYFANENGALCMVERVMDRDNAISPRALLEQLIAGPYVFDVDGGARSVVPDGVNDADILGIRIDGDTALVNLSSNFYRLCQDFTPEQERNLVYAMVNTLTEISEVSRVRFYVGDSQVDYLVDSIYLRASLLPNPGLVEGVGGEGT